MCKDNTYLRNPDVALREEDESGSLLFNPDTGEVLVINDTARFIWELCSEGVTMDDIVHAFAESYDDLPENLIEDVDSYLLVMTKGGFIGSK
ncbi:MAG: PqqD family peptide modification chaperone [Candidatus Aegiribacteria sp.]|nr:PqqD family peptide modification chaperone [Candidatus Aegiribacteria sp.]